MTLRYSQMNSSNETVHTNDQEGQKKTYPNGRRVSIHVPSMGRTFVGTAHWWTNSALNGSDVKTYPDKPDEWHMELTTDGDGIYRNFKQWDADMVGSTVTWLD